MCHIFILNEYIQTAKQVLTCVVDLKFKRKLQKSNLQLHEVFLYLNKLRKLRWNSVTSFVMGQTAQIVI